MKLNVEKELAGLRQMTVKELQTRFADTFGEPTNAHNKTWLVKRIAWRLQALAEGDLSERARQRAKELARDADLRISAPKTTSSPCLTVGPTCYGATALRANTRLPMPGTIITRTYKGRQLQVKILPQGGFEFDGANYKSLSAVAKAITGQHCNGYHFFRLGKGKEVSHAANS
ncbi:MAG: DUF2924 domain-containing protein [Pirellulales bacterium]|nr:DUF2924 domain-containing protein [Pirellulales bacterium]